MIEMKMKFCPPKQKIWRMEHQGADGLFYGLPKILSGLLKKKFLEPPLF
jgi:hypothetical protein